MYYFSFLIIWRYGGKYYIKVNNGEAPSFCRRVVKKRELVSNPASTRQDVKLSVLI